MTAGRPIAAARRRGFTLVELVVVLGVVVFLLGLTLTVGVGAVEQAERRHTRQVLQRLDLAVEEWELTSERKLSWWNYQNPADDPATWDRFDVHGDTDEMLIITEILDVIMRTDRVRQLMAGLDPELLYRYEAGAYPRWIDNPTAESQVDDRFDGSLTVLDAWGWPIYATHPGRLWTSADAGSYGDGADPDGTIQTYNEAKYGATVNRRIRFVSAGPDGDFGVVYADPDGQYAALFEATKDNVYSY